MTRLERLRRRVRNARHVWVRTDWDRVRRYVEAGTEHRRMPWFRLARLMWRHGASPEDALVLELLGKPDCIVGRRLTRSRRHEFTVATSDPSAWSDLSDKWRFAERFGDLMGRPVLPAPQALRTLRSDPSALGPELVVKRRVGANGVGQRFIPAPDAIGWLGSLSADELDGWVVEGVLTAHPEIARLLPGVLHTLRVCTFLGADGLEVWPPVLRVGVGGIDAAGRPIRVDTSSSGGIAVAVGVDGRLASTGRVRDPAVAPMGRHPVTGVPFAEVVIPWRAEIDALVRQAAARIPAVRSIGWDVAVTLDGPVIIEGNHNWGEFVLELTSPAGSGWNPLLTRHVPDVVYGGGCRHCRRAANRSHPRWVKFGPERASW